MVFHGSDVVKQQPGNKINHDLRAVVFSLFAPTAGSVLAFVVIGSFESAHAVIGQSYFPIACVSFPALCANHLYRACFCSNWLI